MHTTDPQSTLARKQMLEFTLVNHPIDCPICDKAGECTLQKLYFDADNADSRVDTPKVHKAKVVDLGPTVVLDQERCILCSRCIRACDETSGQHQLEFAHRGDHEILTTAPGEQLDNPYSMNVVDVCPVGALTAKDFRFTMRAWELESTPSICNGCSTGCNIEVHHRNGRAWRLIPRHNEEVNKYWMCDEGRFTYHDLREDRLAGAAVDGLPAGWDRSIRAAADRLASARGQGGLAVVLSATASNEDNYALAKLAQSWGLTSVYVAGRPPVPARADGRLRTADINANTAGVKAIAEAMKLTTKPIFELDKGVKGLLALGDVLPGVTEERIKEIEYGRARDARARHRQAGAHRACRSRRGPRSVGLGDERQGPRAAHAPGRPRAGSGARRLGGDRAHRAGDRLDGGEAQLAQRARSVLHRDDRRRSRGWSGLKWAREARPLALRFAGSRG